MNAPIHGTCRTCGRPPGFECRAHFAAEIARLRLVLDRITDLSGFFRDGKTWPESSARKALQDIDALAREGRRSTPASPDPRPTAAPPKSTGTP